MKKNKKIILFFLMIGFFHSKGCEDVKPINEPFPLSGLDFVFLQASKKFFFSVNASSSYQNVKLDSVMALWMGMDSTSTPDTLKLYDDGTLGDMIPSDNMFSRKILNAKSDINNIVQNPNPSRDSLYVSIVGVYGNKEKKMPIMPFTFGNVRPTIENISYPDTVTRPATNPDPNKSNTVKFLLTATVKDGNGSNDIKRVFFKSYDVDKELWRTDLKGDQILFNLYDDGTGDSGSGDLQSGDDTYSLNIFIIDTTSVGTYHWFFQAQDLSNDYSDEIKKIIVIK